VGATSQHGGRRCWSESGAHFFAKESDGVWVCQICGDVRQMGNAAAGREQ